MESKWSHLVPKSSKSLSKPGRGTTKKTREHFVLFFVGLRERFCGQSRKLVELEPSRRNSEGDSLDVVAVATKLLEDARSTEQHGLKRIAILTQMLLHARGPDGAWTQYDRSCY